MRRYALLRRGGLFVAPCFRGDKGHTFRRALKMPRALTLVICSTVLLFAGCATPKVTMVQQATVISVILSEINGMPLRPQDYEDIPRNMAGITPQQRQEAVTGIKQTLSAMIAESGTWSADLRKRIDTTLATRGLPSIEQVR